MSRSHQSVAELWVDPRIAWQNVDTAIVGGLEWVNTTPCTVNWLPKGFQNLIEILIQTYKRNMRPFKSPECGFVANQSFDLNYQSNISAFLQLLLNLPCFGLDSAEFHNKELISLLQIHTIYYERKCT